MGLGFKHIFLGDTIWFTTEVVGFCLFCFSFCYPGCYLLCEGTWGKFKIYAAATTPQLGTHGCVPRMFLQNAVHDFITKPEQSDSLEKKGSSYLREVADLWRGSFQVQMN